jgi:ribosomal protein S18 acetylase RimI-like enzyme
VRRVEAQLLLLDSPLKRKVPYASRFKPHPRRFLEAPASHALALPAREPEGVAIAPWKEAQQDDSARLVAAAYRGHIDSEINDQYRSPSGSRRFLSNIVQYPGCGTFFAPASFAAVASNGGKGELCGISLASLVARETGHITQICVAPSQRGKGVGYALLRRSMLALAAQGCRTVGLTVTSKNTGAIRLYEQMGFTDRRDFAAYVWDS